MLDVEKWIGAAGKPFRAKNTAKHKGVTMKLVDVGIKGKIFCLSMQRSGTTSVGDFLEQWGVKRFGHQLSWQNQWSRHWFNGNYEAIFSSELFADHEVFEDDPFWFPDFFKYIHHKVPDSRFILLSRDADSWFKSMIRHSNGFTLGPAYLHAKVYRREDDLRWLEEHVPDFKGAEPKSMVLYDKAEHYKAHYLRHNLEVEKFFSGPRAKYLFKGQLSDPLVWENIKAWLGFPGREGVKMSSHSHKARSEFTRANLLVVGQINKNKPKAIKSAGQSVLFEKKDVVEFAKEGVKAICNNFGSTTLQPFSSAPYVPTIEGPLEQYADYLKVNSVDLLFARLSVLHSVLEGGKVEEIMGGKDIKSSLESSLAFVEKSLYEESAFERQLANKVQELTSLKDDEIKARFTTRFTVNSDGIMTLPTDRTLVFTKVNHGYWEFMRSAYDAQHAQRNPDLLNVRNINHKIRWVRTSGLTQFWARQIHRLAYDNSEEKNQFVTLGVSLVAGMEQPARSLSRDLSPVTRGAALGLLSMYETAIPERSNYSVADGGAARSLIVGGKLEEFFGKYISDSEACLFVVPPHLEKMDFVSFKGDIYKFLVPPTRINETWKLVAASLMGCLIRLGDKYKSITVLAQGGAVVSLIALMISDINPIPKMRLRFFDLGRVLDVVEPEVLKKQGWSNQNLEGFVAEGKKIFVMR